MKHWQRWQFCWRSVRYRPRLPSRSARRRPRSRCRRRPGSRCRSRLCGQERRPLRLHRRLHAHLNARGRGPPTRPAQVREPQCPGPGHQQRFRAGTAGLEREAGPHVPARERPFAEDAGELRLPETDPKSQLYPIETRVRHHRQDGDGSLRERSSRVPRSLVTDDELLAELDKLK